MFTPVASPSPAVGAASFLTYCIVTAEDERHDSFIVAEAALCEADILVSADAHLHGIDHQRLHVLLSSFDVKPIIITWPRRVARLLGGRRA